MTDYSGLNLFDPERTDQACLVFKERPGMPGIDVGNPIALISLFDIFADQNPEP
ncbi:MAG: hypothetical protein IH594_12895 [Bacteroidales bacterium]|nr:hypothetical protein [Bacteroidales bacterium]